MKYITLFDKMQQKSLIFCYFFVSEFKRHANRENGTPLIHNISKKRRLSEDKRRLQYQISSGLKDGINCNLNKFF